MKKFLLVLGVAMLALPLATGCPSKSVRPESGVVYEASERDVFLNEHVYFDFDRYNIRPDAAAVLNAKANFMSKYNGVTVEIQGHCDERGTEAYNMALGDRRAKAAYNYMVNAGVSGARMSTISYGEERPLDPGHNEAAWARNRRAQFIITSN